MEQSGTSALLTGAVQDLASDVVSALRSGDHVRAGSIAADGASRGLELAAVRVLGADVLLPHVLRRTAPGPDRLGTVREALTAFPPPPGASPTVVWSHWALAGALRRFEPAAAPVPEPAAAWLDGASWQVLTHQLAVLAPLALPDGDCAVTHAAQNRPVDVARGFVRAVRRRDWHQAAGAGRWLTVLHGVPDTLGLDAGLDFVELMAGPDPRVLLHVAAARSMRAGVLA